MADIADAPPRRQSRFWLFAPFTVVGLVIVAWCAAWFVIRARTAEGIDAWIAQEAQAGRQWACPGRAIGGFPFRVEIECASVTLRRGDLSATVERVEAVAQIYRPRHVIVRAAGPLRATEGARVTEGRWRLLEASLRTSPAGLQQLAAVSEGLALSVTGAAPDPVTATLERLEVHARPSPASTDGSVDVAARATGAAIPLLDALLGTRDAAQVELQARASQGLRLGGPSALDDLERWRLAGGFLDVVVLKVAKGAGRLEAKGRLGLDEERRLAGNLDGAAAGIEGVLRQVLGGDGRAGLAAGLLGALTGRAPRAPDAAPGLQPLPPLRFEGGRVFLGPLPLPGVRLTPLF